MYLITYHDTVAVLANTTQEYLEKIKELFRMHSTVKGGAVTFYASLNNITHSFSQPIGELSTAEIEDHALVHFIQLAKATGKYRFYREVSR